MIFDYPSHGKSRLTDPWDGFVFIQTTFFDYNEKGIRYRARLGRIFQGGYP